MKFDPSAALQSLRSMAIGFFQQLAYIVIALLVFALFCVVARLTRRVIRNLTKRRRKHRNVGLVLGHLAEGGLLLVGVLVALVIAIPSFNPAQLIQILGISSVAIGFAFRDILQNFLAGILILLTEPFRLGDQIVVGSFEGTVEEIETRATSIRTLRRQASRHPIRHGQHRVRAAPAAIRCRHRLRRRYRPRAGVILEALGSAHGVLRDPHPRRSS